MKLRKRRSKKNENFITRKTYWKVAKSFTTNESSVSVDNIIKKAENEEILTVNGGKN